MKTSIVALTVWFVFLVSAIHGQTLGASLPVTVDCSAGQSLNQTLSKLDRSKSYTVSVKGVCTEYVQVFGFQNLRLKGLPGATLLQPTSGGGGQFTLLMIESSRDVNVDGFTIQTDITTIDPIGVGHGSSDIELRNLNLVGGIFGIIVFENSQVSLAYVTAQDPGYAPLGVYDSSDVHIDHCAFEDTTGASWHAGIDVGASHITMYGTTISNMQVGISGHSGAIVDVSTFSTTNGLTDVTIKNSAGTSFWGVSMEGGGSLNVGNAKLMINKSGQSWGGTTAGVFLSDGAVMNASSGNLVISGSQGQGVVALNNSHATLNGATVTGGLHGGLVAANLSSIDVSSANSSILSTVGGNGVDLFCDSDSKITGSANIAGVPTAQCANLLGMESVALP